MHWLKMLLLGKKFVLDVRKQCVKPGSVVIEHDFTEALTIRHNQEIQLAHFGGGIQVSIEGFTVYYPDPNDPVPCSSNPRTCDFHSFLSDDTTQLASTVYFHMNLLIVKLFEQGILKNGGRILGSTDGCGKQYKCVTAIHFMSILSVKHGIVIDRAIGCPGHGKCLVDAINGVDKNTIYRETMKQMVKPEEASQSSTSSLQSHSYSNVEGLEKYSAAMNCKFILEGKGSEGVKSGGPKRAKREAERGINRRY